LIDPNLKYSEVFKETAAEARVSSRGIWNRWDDLSEKLSVITWQQADQNMKKLITRDLFCNRDDNPSFLTKIDDKSIMTAFPIIRNKYSYLKVYNPLLVKPS